MAETEGRKDDGGKDPWHLVPWDATRAIVKVLAFGAGKYSERNWEKGMAWSRCYSALLRHLTAWWEGEKADKETGYSHLWHAGCCVVFLIAYEIRGVGVDDRPLVERLRARYEPPDEPDARQYCDHLRAINTELVEALRDIENCDIYGPVGIAVLKTKARVAIAKAERGNSNE